MISQGAVISMLLVFAHAQEPWADNLNERDGLSYIRAAEDLATSGSSKSTVKELYVLAAVIDPMYRESAILGVISIERNDELIARLHNLRTQPPLLVPNVVHNAQFNTGPKTDIESICDALVSYRRGRTLSVEQIDTLRPWSYVLPSSFDVLFDGTSTKLSRPNADAITNTLHVELSLHGGATLWSSDYATVGSTPVVLNMSDDLATLLRVDPTRIKRRNGRWVAE